MLVLTVQHICVCSVRVSLRSICDLCVCVSPDYHLPQVLSPEHSNGVFLAQGSEPCVNTFKTYVCVWVCAVVQFHQPTLPHQPSCDNDGGTFTALSVGVCVCV